MSGPKVPPNEGLASGGLAQPEMSPANAANKHAVRNTATTQRKLVFAGQAARSMVNKVFKRRHFILNKQLLGGPLTLEPNRQLIKSLEKSGSIASAKLSVITLALARFP